MKTSSLTNIADFSEAHQGSLSYTLASNILDTSYISTSNNIFGQPPYLFYMQLAYDISLEGPLSVSLFKHDKETLTFEELSLGTVT
jgi:hypothetical protein